MDIELSKYGRFKFMTTDHRVHRRRTGVDGSEG